MLLTWFCILGFSNGRLSKQKWLNEGPAPFFPNIFKSFMTLDWLLRFKTMNKWTNESCVLYSTCFNPTVSAMFPALIEGISTCWSANGTSSRLILSLKTKHLSVCSKITVRWRYSGAQLEQKCSTVCNLRVVPVQVVNSCLGFQSTRVYPEENQRTALFVMENLEGQRTQVLFVPPPVRLGTRKIYAGPKMIQPILAALFFFQMGCWVKALYTILQPADQI